MHKHIVTAVDDSPTSQRAIRAAVDLAQASGARLTLVHAVDEALFAHFSQTEATFASKEAVEQALIKEGQSVLDSAYEIARAAGGTPEVRLSTSRHDSISDQIAHVLKELGADLLVLGSHGRRGVKRMFLGGVAERLMRKVDISVMIVRGEHTD